MEAKCLNFDHPADLKAMREREWEGRGEHNQWQARLGAGEWPTSALSSN